MVISMGRRRKAQVMRLLLRSVRESRWPPWDYPYGCLMIHLRCLVVCALLFSLSQRLLLLTKAGLATQRDHDSRR